MEKGVEPTEVEMGGEKEVQLGILRKGEKGRKMKV